MPRIANHVRSNLIAYLALFVALGGSSYAALSLPAGSVGTRQLRKGAVTPQKLDAKLIGGSVRAWAYVSAAGGEVAGSGIHGVRYDRLSPGEYALLLNDMRVRGCAATASVAANPNPRNPNLYAPGSAVARVVEFGHAPVGVGVDTYNPAGQAAPLPFLVEILC